MKGKQMKDTFLYGRLQHERTYFLDFATIKYIASSCKNVLTQSFNKNAIVSVTHTHAQQRVCDREIEILKGK